MTLNQKAEVRADAAGPASADDKLDKLLKGIDVLTARMDSDDKARSDSENKVLAKLDEMGKRLDACESDMKARKDAEEKEKDEKAKADAAARKDADEKTAKEKEEKERADAAAEKEREEKERADAAARAQVSPAVMDQIKALEKRIPLELSADDRKLFVGAQQRADRVAHAFADDAGAPRWLNGETLNEYRRRLLGKYKGHSSAWKDVDLTPFADKALDTVEAQIYADAMTAAVNPASVEAGMLRPVVSEDVTGRRITRFVGDPEACWGAFKQPYRAVTGMNPPIHRN